MHIHPLSIQDQTAVAAMQAETLELLRTLCRIPAPSHHEERRAQFVKEWLEKAGAQGVYIDEAKNVIYEMRGESERLCVVMAHTDTVFPDTQPMEVHEEGDRMLCPGVGDDTANLAALLMLVRHWIQNGYRPKKSFLFVANACEEGLGNLKGCRAVMEKQLQKILAAQDHETVQWEVTCVGLRPCGREMPPEGQAELTRAALEAIEGATGTCVGESSGSTDCNIPLSRGIRSVCFGAYEGGGAHTREEWIQKSSLGPGMTAALMLMYALDDVQTKA